MNNSSHNTFTGPTRYLLSVPGKKTAKQADVSSQPDSTDQSEEIQSNAESLSDEQRDSIVSIRRSALELSTHFMETIPGEVEFSSSLDMEWTPLLHLLTGHATIFLVSRQLRTKDKAVIGLSSSIWNICSTDHSFNASLLFDLYGGAKGHLTLSQLLLVVIDLALGNVSTTENISSDLLGRVCTTSLNTVLDIHKFVSSVSSSSSQPCRQPFPDTSILPEETEEYDRCDPNNSIFHDISGDYQDDLLCGYSVQGMTTTARRGSSSSIESNLQEEEFTQEMLRLQPSKSCLSRIQWMLSSDVMCRMGNALKSQSTRNLSIVDEPGRRGSLSRSNSMNVRSPTTSPTNASLMASAIPPNDPLDRSSTQFDRISQFAYMHPCSNEDVNYPLSNSERRYRMFRIVRCVFRACIRRSCTADDGSAPGRKASCIDWNFKVPKLYFKRFFETKRPEILLPLKTIKEKIMSKFVGLDFWEKASLHRSILAGDDGNCYVTFAGQSFKVNDFFQFAEFLCQKIDRLISTDDHSVSGSTTISSSTSTPVSARSIKSQQLKSHLSEEGLASRIPSPTSSRQLTPSKVFVFDAAHSDPVVALSEAADSPSSPANKPPKRGIFKSLSKMLKESGSSIDDKSDSLTPPSMSVTPKNFNASGVSSLGTETTDSESRRSNDTETNLTIPTPSPSNSTKLKRMFSIKRHKDDTVSEAPTETTAGRSNQPTTSEFGFHRLSMDSSTYQIETPRSSVITKQKLASKDALQLRTSTGPITYHAVASRANASFSNDDLDYTPMSSPKNDNVISPRRQSLTFSLSPKNKTKQDSDNFDNPMMTTISPSAKKPFLSSPRNSVTSVPIATKPSTPPMHASHLSAIKKLMRQKKEAPKNSPATANSPSPAGIYLPRAVHSHSVTSLHSPTSHAMEMDSSQFAQDALRNAGSTSRNLTVNTNVGMTGSVSVIKISPDRAHRNSAPTLKQSPKHVNNSGNSNTMIVRVISSSRANVVTGNASVGDSRESFSSTASSESSYQKPVSGNFTRTPSGRMVQIPQTSSKRSGNNTSAAHSSRLPIQSATIGTSVGRSSFSVSQEGDDNYIEDSYSGLRSSISSSVGSEFSLSSNVVVNNFSVQNGHWPMTPDGNSAVTGVSGVMSSPRSAKSMPLHLYLSNPSSPDSTKRLRKNSFGSVDSSSNGQSSRRFKGTDEDAEYSQQSSSSSSIVNKKMLIRTADSFEDDTTYSEGTHDSSQIFSLQQVNTPGNLSIDGEGLLRMVDEDA